MYSNSSNGFANGTASSGFNNSIWAPNAGSASRDHSRGPARQNSNEADSVTNGASGSGAYSSSRTPTNAYMPTGPAPTGITQSMGWTSSRPAWGNTPAENAASSNQTNGLLQGSHPLGPAVNGNSRNLEGLGGEASAFDSISTKNGELVSIKLQDVGSAVDRIWIMLLFETVLSIFQQSADSLQ